MGWTTRNNEKSGSYPSLKLAVEIQSSEGWNSGEKFGKIKNEKSLDFLLFSVNMMFELIKFTI